MKTLDRYIIRSFLLNFLILFVVVVGLIVLLDLIVNFDEFVQAGQKAEGGWRAHVGATLWAIADFYGPLVFLMYNYMAGLLPLGAAAFTLASLVRNRELVAMLASGISAHRIAMPLLALGFATNVAMVLNQELVLPRLTHKLARDHADVKAGRARTMALRFVPDGQGALYTAETFDPAERTMENVTILRRRPVGDGTYGRAVERITADQARWVEGEGGWELVNGFAVRRKMEAEAGQRGFTARNLYEVNFVPSQLDPLTLTQRQRARYRELLSLRQLQQLMDKPEIVNTAELRRIMHSRFSLVVINMLILAMGLPYFLPRVPGSLLIPAVKAAALCVGAWAGGWIMLQIAPGALPPAAVAWLPVAIYLPVGFYQMDNLPT